MGVLTAGLPASAGDGKTGADKSEYPRPLIEDAIVIADSSLTCFRITSTARLGSEVYSVKSPERVVIDTPAAAFRLPRRIKRVAGGLVAGFRYGVLESGVARIVVDVAAGTRIGQIRNRRGDDGRHIISVQLLRPRQEARQGTADCAQQLVRAASNSDAAAGNWQVRTAVNRAKPPDKKPLPVVVIDPGHGGIDPGAVTDGGYSEKKIVLSVSLRLARLLRNSSRFKVVLTRNRDTFISLDDRVDKTRAVKGDLFISLHADAVDDPAQAPLARGAAVYILSHRASDAEAKRVAEKENAADFLAGVLTKSPDDSGGVRNILVDLLKRETERESARLQSLIVRAMRGSVQLAREPERSAAFHVLKQTETPAALVELGYMTNARDLSAMQQAEWQTKVAQAIADAVGKFVDGK